MLLISKQLQNQSGTEARSAVEQSMEVGLNVGRTTVNMRRVGTRALVKAAAKKTVKQGFGDTAEEEKGAAATIPAAVASLAGVAAAVADAE
jgi:hypothetical protein